MPHRFDKKDWLYLSIASIAALLVFFVNLGTLDYMGRDEIRRAQVVRVMHDTGDYVVPRQTADGPPYLSKPAQWYWHAALCAKLTGTVSEFSNRLPSAVAGLLIAVLVFLLGRSMAGRETGLLAALVYTVFPAVLLQSRQATLDMTLALFVTLALFAFWRGYENRWNRRLAFTLFWFFAGFAFATKFIIGLAVPLAGVTAFLIMEKQLRVFFNRHTLWQAFAFFPPALPWYVAACLALDASPAKLWELIRHEVVVVAIDSYAHKRAFHYFLQVFPLLTLPWSPAFLIALFNWRRWGRSVGPGKRFLLCVFLPNFLLFSLYSSKQDHYLLPLYPAVALLTALFFTELCENTNRRLWRLCGVFFPATLAGAGVLLPLATRSWDLEVVRLQIMFLAPILAAEAAILLILLFAQKWRALLWTYLGCFIASFVTLVAFVLPTYSKLTSCRALGRHIQNVGKNVDTVYVFGGLNVENLYHYTDKKCKGIVFEADRRAMEKEALQKGRLKPGETYNLATIERLLEENRDFLIITDVHDASRFPERDFRPVLTVWHVQFKEIGGLHDVCMFGRWR